MRQRERLVGRALVERWSSQDVATLLRRRLEGGDDGRVLGTWSRAAQRLEIVPQHQFLRQALTLAARLRDQGVEPGDALVVDCGTPRATLLAYLAAVCAAGVPVITPVRLGAQRTSGSGAAELCRRLGAAMVVTDRAPRGATAEGQAPLGDFDADHLAPAATVDSALLAPAPPDAPLHLQLTSGSTGLARAAAVTHGNVMANCGALTEVVGMVATDSITSWLPLYHDMGLIGTVMPSLLQATDLYLLSPFDFLADPLLWLRVISERASAVTASPNFGYEVAAARALAIDEPLDLTALRVACCGGEPIRPGTVAAFLGGLARWGLRPDALRPCYGLAEATLAVSFARHHRSPTVLRVAVAADGSAVDVRGRRGATDPAGPARPGELDLVSCGRPMPGIDVTIVDPETGRPVDGEDRAGVVTVAGASVVRGVWGAGGVEPRPERLDTGDIGFLHGGELYLLERATNLIIRHGQNLPASALEAALADACGVSADRVMVVERDIHDPGGPLVGVLELPRHHDVAALAARAAAAGRSLDLPLDRVLLVRRGSLPRTTSGKKQHAALRRALQDASLPVLADVPTADLRAPGTVIDLRGEGDPRITRVPPGPGGPGVPGGRSGPVGPAAGPERAAVEQAVLDEVRAICRARGTADAVRLSAALRQDLDLDSLALLEVVTAVEERTRCGIGDRALADLRTVDDLVAAALAHPGEIDVSGLHALQRRYLEGIPQVALVVGAQSGRVLDVTGRRVVDFASCNYLGLDLHPAVMAAIEPLVRRWGVHPSWTRAVASPAPYAELERRLAALVGAPDVVVFPTVSLLHLGVLPVLTGTRGALLVDQAAHHSVHEAAELCRARGAKVLLYRHGDHEDLERKLQATAGTPSRVIAVDGVYSMSGELADVAALAGLAEAHDALVYIDDAHGFGVIGENPGPGAPFGRRGNGVVRHLGVASDRLVYVAGLSKAYSSMGAFVTCPGPEVRTRLAGASTLVFGGPVPTASLASALAGLDVNDREGDAIRHRLHGLTTALVEGVAALGLPVSNANGFPIVTVQLGGLDEVIAACRVLWDHGILVTPAVFPAVPLDAGGVRFSVTAANTPEQVGQAVDALAAATRARGHATLP